MVKNNINKTSSSLLTTEVFVLAAALALAAAIAMISPSITAAYPVQV